MIYKAFEVRFYNQLKQNLFSLKMITAIKKSKARDNPPSQDNKSKPRENSKCPKHLGAKRPMPQINVGS